MHEENARKTQWQFNAIHEQLSEQAESLQERRHEEKALDQAYLKETAETQLKEDQRKREKEIASKANMRKAWLEQMAYKSAFKATDALFY